MNRSRFNSTKHVFFSMNNYAWLTVQLDLNVFFISSILEILSVFTARSYSEIPKQLRLVLLQHLIFSLHSSIILSVILLRMIDMIVLHSELHVRDASWELVWWCSHLNELAMSMSFEKRTKKMSRQRKRLIER